MEPLLLIDEFLSGGGGALAGPGDIRCRLIDETLWAGGGGAGFIRCGGGGGAFNGGGGGNEVGGLMRCGGGGGRTEGGRSGPLAGLLTPFPGRGGAVLFIGLRGNVANRIAGVRGAADTCES